MLRVKARLYLKEVTSGPTRPEMAEKLAMAANKFLGPNGVIVVCNRGEGNETPDFIKKMPLMVKYMDKSGKNIFAEVRGKLNQ